MGRRVSGCLLASRGLSLNRSAFTTGGGDLSKTGLSTSQDKRMKTRLSLDIRQPHWGTWDQRRMRTKLPLRMADAGFWEWPLPPKGVESQESRIPFLTASRSASRPASRQSPCRSVDSHRHKLVGSVGFWRARFPPSEAVVRLHICSCCERLASRATVEVLEKGLR